MDESLRHGEDSVLQSGKPKEIFDIKTKIAEIKNRILRGNLSADTARDITRELDDLEIRLKGLRGY